MPSLRILHVTPYAPGAWSYGGIPRVAASFARTLARRGHDVTVCTTDACSRAERLSPDGSPGPLLRAWPPYTTATRLTTRVFPNLSNRLAYDWQLFTPVGLGRYLQQHAASFDVAHLHACRNLPGVIAARHLQRVGVPFLLAPNGTAPNFERRQVAKRVFDITLGRRVLRDAACVLAVSGAERRQLLDLGVRERSIRVIPNPLDVDEFAGPITRGRIRRQFGIGRAPLVVFLGKLTPRKRVDVLVEAFARLGHEQARLVIAGNDMGAGRCVQAVVRRLGLGRRTFFTGLHTGRSRLEVLAEADVVVYASEREIFGLVPLEAILSGTPVVVADDCGCGDVIGATGGGAVVKLGDVEALARAICSILDNREQWRARVSAASVEVRATFASEVVTTQLEAVYHAMHASVRAGPRRFGARPVEVLQRVR